MLSVREIRPSDIEPLLKYWFENDDDYFIEMGADPKKMPPKEQFEKMLSLQIEQSYKEKQSYAMIWEIDGVPAGHSNANNITFGESANMHLHLWRPDLRQKGMGTALVKMTLPFFFKNLALEVLYSEPYALNPAPNKTLAKIGFEFIKKYVTIPGSINFEQEVNRWQLTKAVFLEMGFK